jgi:hypothetical protein
MSSQPTTTKRERRAFERFRIEHGVQYSVIGNEISGSGKTVNISRGGVLLAIDRVLACGLSVELEVDWPVRLANEDQVQLIIRGKIVWSKKNGVALTGVTIAWYEFHPVS